jgi:sensor histidine kinase YesM
MVEDCRDRAISQLNHALGTLTAAVDTATVRHHLDYVKTRLTQYIHTAETMLEIKDLQLVAKQNEIKSMEKIIQDLEEQNRYLREKHNSPPPPPPGRNWQGVSHLSSTTSVVRQNENRETF